MKLLIFGIGRFYHKHKRELEQYLDDDEVVGFIDNQVKDRLFIDGILIYSPLMIQQLSYDKIILMSVSSHEMKEQLLGLGVAEGKILFWDQYVALCSHGKLELHVGSNNGTEKRILVISTSQDYVGGCLAAIYAVEALKQKGYDVWLAVPGSNKKLLQEMTARGINTILAPSLPYVGMGELAWIRTFDLVLVNVFQMLQAAYTISKIKPVVWWLHEDNWPSTRIYETILYQFRETASKLEKTKFPVYAVSNIAKVAFETFYPNRVMGILPYGIPDESPKNGRTKRNERPFVFALIGGVGERKGQQIFVNAAKRVLAEMGEDVEFWMIGAYGENAYTETVKVMMAGTPQIKLCGRMTRKELRCAFDEIDAVVCSSMVETMSIAITEGMMHSKICIATDATGIADFIQDGENGFVCKTGDAEALAERMEWALAHEGELEPLRRKARETYEKYFSMKVFGDRLEQVMLDAERRFSASL